MRVISLLLTWVLIAWPAVAEACSCGSGDPDLSKELRDARATAHTIFHGRVVAVTRSGGLLGWLGLGSKEARFEVLESFKGSVGPELVLPSGSADGPCTTPFAPEREYLVYASLYDGKLESSLCSRTRQVDRNDIELDWLRTGTLPPVPVALQRETVRCTPCDLDTVTTTLIGLPDRNQYTHDSDEAAKALGEGRPFWTGAFYNRDDRTRTTAVGLSRELRPFELVQTPLHGTQDTCRQRVSLRWCARLEASGEDFPQPGFRCVNPSPEQEMCDETKSRTAEWGPKERIQAAQCIWRRPDRPSCELRKEFQPLAAEAPASPLLVCEPAFGRSWAHRCQVLPAGEAGPR
jgi:hypothetical protein